MIRFQFFAKAALVACIGFAIVAATNVDPTVAQRKNSFADSQDQRPYDDKLMRLAEILGAVHYLRELCHAKEGQRWRKLMAALIDAEGTTAKRRSRLVRQFNRGYRGYQRTYRSCTRPATLAVGRFLKEGQMLSKTIIRTSK